MCNTDIIFFTLPSFRRWFIVTATTVGYGDTYPITGQGKIIASFAMLLGVLVIAFPVSVFSGELLFYDDFIIHKCFSQLIFVCKIFGMKN